MFERVDVAAGCLPVTAAVFHADNDRGIRCNETLQQRKGKRKANKTRP
jgi:hypothetical protein